MTELLQIENLTVAYGQVLALKGVTLTVGAGEAVALVGANGAGKSTLFKSIVGFLRPRSGRLSFLGRDMTSVSPERRARLGLGYAPEGRRVFPGLTVRENLEVAVFGSKAERAHRLDQAFALFPQLAERQAQSGWQLSGGQQQMLAIGRALMGQPQLTSARRALARAVAEARRRGSRRRPRNRAARHRGPPRRAECQEGAGLLRPRLRPGNRQGRVIGGERGAARYRRNQEGVSGRIVHDPIKLNRIVV
jgi:ABC-type Fe3+/spermidine/putrescine transport system ATPase subunit